MAEKFYARLRRLRLKRKHDGQLWIRFPSGQRLKVRKGAWWMSKFEPAGQELTATPQQMKITITVDPGWEDFACLKSSTPESNDSSGSENATANCDDPCTQ